MFVQYTVFLINIVSSDNIVYGKKYNGEKIALCKPKRSGSSTIFLG